VFFLPPAGVFLASGGQGLKPCTHFRFRARIHLNVSVMLNLFQHPWRHCPDGRALRSLSPMDAETSSA
jgi:hypothetical protein